MKTRHSGWVVRTVYQGILRLHHVVLALLMVVMGMIASPRMAYATTHHVPGDYPTIQAAVDAAQDGDVIVIAPGIYNEQVRVAGKRVILASTFYTTGNRDMIDQTIIDGGRSEYAIRIDRNASGTEVIGLTIRNASDGIQLLTQTVIRDNRITGTSDGIDSTSGGGHIQGNVFEANRDDGVDFDQASSGTIENNIIRNNNDDGIEIRLHDVSGPRLTITIRGNSITGNGEDGIQLIDYPALTDRVFVIERNLIQGNEDAGIGLMDNGVSKEDFRGASIPEPIFVYHNTLVDNTYGLTGGDNLTALNNIFVGAPEVALKNVDGDSVVAHNLFWNNGSDYVDSNVDQATTVLADPLLNAEYALSPGSPAIDAGTTAYEEDGETIIVSPAADYAGAAPDLGWKEYTSSSDTPTPTPTPQPADVIFADAFESGDMSMWSGTKINHGDLSVSAEAGLEGNYGLLAVVNDNASLYLVDDYPEGEARYRARFYFDPNGLAMRDGDSYFLLHGDSLATAHWRPVLKIEMRYGEGGYQVRAGLRQDNGNWWNSVWFPISDTPHLFELDWRAATAPHANDGALAFWIDGSLHSDLTGIDNDTWHIDRVRLGVVGGIDSGTRGSLFFDAFESRQQSYIGPAAGVEVTIAEAAPVNPEWLHAWVEQPDTPDAFAADDSTGGGAYLPLLIH